MKKGNKLKMGYLIALDGIDASGKSTQSAIFFERLKETLAGRYDVSRISFPNYDSDSSMLVKMYLSGKLGSNADSINPYAASSFYAVDRFASYISKWKEFYQKENSIIIADRYTTANAIHQLPKLDKSRWDSFLGWLWDLEFGKLEIPEPDLIIWLDMHIDVAVRLIEERAVAKGISKDIHEADTEYLKRCYEAAQYAAKYLGWKRIVCYEKDEGGEALIPSTIEKISADILKCATENIKF